MYTCPVLPIFVLWNWVNHNNYSWVPLSIVSLYCLIIFVKLLVFPFYRREILTSEKVIWGHTASVVVGEVDFKPCFWHQSTYFSKWPWNTSESPAVFENQKFLGLCLSKSTSWGVRRIDNYFLNKHPRRFLLCTEAWLQLHKVILLFPLLRNKNICPFKFCVLHLYCAWPDRNRFP